MRLELGHEEARPRSMKIHFCDLCNESVPQSDLDANRAFVRKGRVVCANCERAMSHDEALAAGARDPRPSYREIAGAGAAPLPPPLAPGAGTISVAARRQSAGTGLAWVALLAAIGVGWWLYDLQDREAREQRRAANVVREDLLASVRDLRGEIADLQQRAQGWNDSVLRQLRDQRASADGALGVLGRDARAVEGRLDAIEAGLGRVEEIGQRVDGATREREQLQEAVSAVVASLDELRREVERVANQAPVVVAAPTPQPAEEAGPDWLDLVGDLESANSGTRWTAVTNLGDTGDPAVVPHLVPLLRDPDIFVRMATARVLGDLAAPNGIPALIEALEDPEAPVREAAVVALRQITGRNFRFDPLADEADRTRKVKAWQEWWLKARDGYLGGGDAP